MGSFGGDLLTYMNRNRAGDKSALGERERFLDSYLQGMMSAGNYEGYMPDESIFEAQYKAEEAEILRKLPFMEQVQSAAGKPYI